MWGVRGRLQISLTELAFYYRILGLSTLPHRVINYDVLPDAAGIQASRGLLCLSLHKHLRMQRTPGSYDMGSLDEVC